MIELNKEETDAMNRLRGVPYAVEPSAAIAGSLLAKGLVLHASIDPMPEDGTPIYLTTLGRGWHDAPAEISNVPDTTEQPLAKPSRITGDSESAPPAGIG